MCLEGAVTYHVPYTHYAFFMTCHDFAVGQRFYEVRQLLPGRSDWGDRPSKT